MKKRIRDSAHKRRKKIGSSYGHLMTRQIGTWQSSSSLSDIIRLILVPPKTKWARFMHSWIGVVPHVMALKSCSYEKLLSYVKHHKLFVYFISTTWAFDFFGMYHSITLMWIWSKMKWQRRYFVCLFPQAMTRWKGMMFSKTEEGKRDGWIAL